MEKKRLSYWQYQSVITKIAVSDTLEFMGWEGGYMRMLRPVGIWGIFFLILFLADKKILEEEFAVWTIGLFSLVVILCFTFIFFLKKAPYKLHITQLERIKSLQLETEDCPFFAIKAPRINKDGDGSLSLLFPMENSGNDSIETNFSLLSVSSNDISIKQHYSTDVARTVRHKEETYWQLPITLPQQHEALFFILAINTKNKHNVVSNQVEFMKWSGVNNGKTFPDLTAITTTEKKKILERLGNTLIAGLELNKYKG